MKQFLFTAALLCAVAVWLRPGRAAAQAMLADDIVLITKGETNKEKARTHQHLSAPGALESRLPASPGSPEARLGEPVGVTANRDVLSSAAYAGGIRPAGGQGPPRITPPAPLLAQKAPLHGPLELPGPGEETPPGGLTLDAAIDFLVSQNYDLRTKFQEIPKADADILSAGLRLNPLLFASVDNVPYGSYSPQRPGETSYTATVIQPIDINRKRLDRIRVAQSAKRVLEAQYQNAVRLEIDNLYTAFVDILDARESVRTTKASLALYEQTAGTVRGLVEKGVQPATELDRVLIQRSSAEVALQAAEGALRQAKRTLAGLLGLPPEQAGCLEVSGTLRDAAPAPPCADDLERLALEARPDLNAFRLGVQRAWADVDLVRKERVSEVYVLYTPATYTDNGPVGGRNTTSWGVGVLTGLPLFNRNQGNIARARVNVTQTQIELAGLERQVVTEVRRAAEEYAVTKAAVQRFEEDILGRARGLRDAQYRLFTSGQAGLGSYLEAQREYSDTLRQYRDTLLRHRRNTLKLNTAVGQRVLP